jgi:hypothetical protein
MGKGLVVLGGVLLVLGALLWLFSKVEGLGNLPGDIRIERPGFTCIIPLASSLILSVLLSIILNVILRLINR